MIRKISSQILLLIKVKLNQNFGKEPLKLITKLVEENLCHEALADLSVDIERFILETAATNEECNSGDVQLKCEAIIDWCWERINCGKWSEVRIEIRQTYAYHQLLKSLFLISRTNNQTPFVDSLFEALDSIDQGLIMSPDLMPNFLTSIASMLNQLIVKLLDSKAESHRWKQKWTEINTRKLHKPKIGVPLLKCKDGCSIKRIDLLDFLEFESDYFRTRTPVVITAATVGWPCMSSRKWSLEYLLRRAAFRQAPIELGSKYTDESWSQEVMTLIDFIDHHLITTDRYKLGYLAQHNLFDQITDLALDFTIPDYCAASDHLEGNLDNPPVDINAWFGPAGTVSPLHTDAKHNIFVQVLGSKYLRLYSSETPAEQIYPHEGHLLANTSKVDVENVNFELYPEFSQIKSTLIHECLLNEGEMLYLPRGWWHFVKSLEVSFSLSFWW